MMGLDKKVLFFVGIVAVLVMWKCWYGKEGFYSDYQVMAQLPFITPPHSDIWYVNAPHKVLGSAEIKANQALGSQPLPRFGPYYDDVARLPTNQGIAVYETGTAYNPNVYSEFGVITPDDLF